MVHKRPSIRVLRDLHHLCEGYLAGFYTGAGSETNGQICLPKKHPPFDPPELASAFVNRYRVREQVEKGTQNWKELNENADVAFGVMLMWVYLCPGTPLDIK